MHMRLLAVPVEVMLMLMMRIVRMAVCMLHRFVLMRMHMVFTEMQPNAHRHQGPRDPEQHVRRIAKKQHTITAPTNGATEK